MASVKQDVTPLCFWLLKLLHLTWWGWQNSHKALASAWPYCVFHKQGHTYCGSGCRMLSMKINPTTYMVERKGWFKDAVRVHTGGCATGHQTTGKGELSIWFCYWVHCCCYLQSCGLLYSEDGDAFSLQIEKAYISFRNCKSGMFASWNCLLNLFGDCGTDDISWKMNYICL